MNNSFFQKFTPNKTNDFLSPLLSQTALVVYTLFLIAVNWLPATGMQGMVQTTYASGISQGSIVQLTNRERTNAGLSTLQVNGLLNLSARNKANHMCEHDYWAHDAPDGTTWYSFIYATGYSGQVGENLAKGFSTAEGVVQGWMGSPTHRANILKPTYTEIGVAVKNCTLQGSATTLVVQHFGARPISPPPPPKEEPKPKPTPKPKPKPKPKPTPKPAPKPRPSPEVVRRVVKIDLQGIEDGLITNDNKLPIKGKVVFAGDLPYEYTLKIYEIAPDGAEVQIAEVTSDTEEWTYMPQEDWAEGEHTIKLVLSTDAGVRSAVLHFTIDTQPVRLSMESIEITPTFGGVTPGENGGQSGETSHQTDTSVSISVRATDIPEGTTVVLRVDDRDTPMHKEGDNYVAVIEELDVLGASTILLFVTDEAGNTSEIDITDSVKDSKLPVVPNANSTDSPSHDENTGRDMLQWFGSNLRSVLLAGFLIYMLLLLMVHIHTYFHSLHMLHHGGHLFSLVIILLVTVVSVANKFNLGGSIL